MMNLVAIAEELAGLTDDQIEVALNRLVARERNSQAVRRMNEQAEARQDLILQQLRNDFKR
jgi:hypothetical protein